MHTYLVECQKGGQVAATRVRSHLCKEEFTLRALHALSFIGVSSCKVEQLTW